MTTLSPEQIACAVEMYRGGNAPRFTMGGLAPLLTTRLLETTYAGIRLNPAGCTIAKMAIALEETRNAATEYRACSLMAHVEDVVIFRSVLERLGRGLEKAKELLG